VLASVSGRRILFLGSKHQARKLVCQLSESEVGSVDLHGHLSQPARERYLAACAVGDDWVLVAPDLASLCVHVDEIELVVRVALPAEHKAYLDRAGRTARAGSAGDVVTEVLPEQRGETQRLLRRAGITVSPQQVAADSAPVRSLVGEVAPLR